MYLITLCILMKNDWDIVTTAAGLSVGLAAIFIQSTLCVVGSKIGYDQGGTSGAIVGGTIAAFPIITATTIAVVQSTMEYFDKN
jgi:hypothetical protein